MAYLVTKKIVLNTKWDVARVRVPRRKGVGGHLLLSYISVGIP